MSERENRARAMAERHCGVGDFHDTCIRDILAFADAELERAAGVVREAIRQG